VADAAGRPRVSVVLIFFDPGAFLEQAIGSVVSQSLADWELILVDDGSRDGSSAVATRWAAEHPGRIRLLQHAGRRNLGMSASRNLGLRAAAADLVTFLDADDVLRSETLEALAAIMDQHAEVAMAYAPLEYWYSWSPRQDRRRDFVQPLGVPTGAIIPPPELLRRFLARRAAAPSGVMIRAARAREVGGFEDAFRGLYEDQAFCAKVCLRWPVATGTFVGYRYRQHPGSSSAVADRSGEVEAGRSEFLSWMEQYCAAEGVADARLLATLRRERWWLRHPRIYRLARRWRRTGRRVLDGMARRASQLFSPNGAA
jgi:glycosyltransferase involved in cell wall biosynthesis